jgi:hypothetical protein
METSSEYKTYYFQMLEESQKYTDFLTVELSKRGLILQMFTSKQYQISHGESHGKIEVKYDRRMCETKNLYIELYEKSNPANKDFIASGVNREDNTILWAQGDYDTLYIFCKKGLKKIIDGCRKIEKDTSIGLLLPMVKADQYCALKIRFNEIELLEFEQKKKTLFKKFEPLIEPRKEVSLDKW